MDRQAFVLFPSLNRSHVLAQVCRDLLPRIESFTLGLLTLFRFAHRVLIPCGKNSEPPWMPQVVKASFRVATKCDKMRHLRQAVRCHLGSSAGASYVQRMTNA